MVCPLYTIRAKGEDHLWDLDKIYECYAGLFSMKVHHGGFFTEWPGMTYEKGKIDYADCINIDEFSVHELDSITEDLEYTGGQVMFYHFLKPGFSLDEGLQPLVSDQDVNNLSNFVEQTNLIHVYIEHGMTNLVGYFLPRKTNVVIEEIPDEDTATSSKPRPKKKTGTYRRLLLDWDEESILTPGTQDNLGQGNVNLDDQGNVNVNENDNGKAVLEDDNVNVEFSSDGENSSNAATDDEDSEDSDFIVDDDNEIEDVDVDMRDFHLHVDADVEFMGGNHGIQENAEVEEDSELDVIHNDQFDSGSDAEDDVNKIRHRLLKNMSKKKGTGEANNICKTGFHLAQTFANSKEVKDMVKDHAIETRRELKIVKNDKTRVRVICEGNLPVFDPSGEVGPSQSDAGVRPLKNVEVGPSVRPKQRKVGPSQSTRSKKKTVVKAVKPNLRCPWTLHVSKVKGYETWMVKTLNEEHTCLQSRSIKHFTSKFIGRSILQQIEGNPEIPSVALQSELQRKFELGLSKQKAARAKRSAQSQLRGDYTMQYNMLRAYVLELQTSNLGTTVKLDVEPPMQADQNTRVFRRIYVCLGALKSGFRSAGRELLGLDGAFMSGPFPAQVLTAVSIDSNNGIYPVAYAIVESETTQSWTWFLECLSQDLDLDERSNYTFISDRQKGIIPALAKVFPGAEHRFCLKHIHENMKLQWRGTAFKNHLWMCATASTVQEFNKCMLEFKRYSEPAYNWLVKIPPQHWARSHFTGRAKSDVLLNNMCEVLNSKTVRGRAMPIIHCLEFIREYLMIRIVNVSKVIAKSKGPLTPTATRLLELIKTEAGAYKAIFNGQDKYQVSGPWGNQYVVDVNKRVCSCRRWEITGIPCKHAVAVNWNIATNNIPVDVVETWVDPIYRLDTWKLMYHFKINPTNGMNMWATCPNEMTTIIPLKYHTPVGRPRKKRRKNAEEIQMVKTGKLTRKHMPVVCTKCGSVGHNKRYCKGGPTQSSQGNPSQSSQVTPTTQSTQRNPTQSSQRNPNQSSQGGASAGAGGGSAGAGGFSQGAGGSSQRASVKASKSNMVSSPEVEDVF